MIDQSTPARHVGRTQPNVVSQELQTGELTAKPAIEAPKEEVIPEVQTPEGNGKNRFSERITELVAKRREAESKEEATRRENDELRARLERFEAAPPIVEADPKPTRSTFASDEDFIEALTDWKATDALRRREQEQAKARQDAQQKQLMEGWESRQNKAMAEIDDYTDVIGASTVQLPMHLYQTIIESEIGPELAYFFAKHPAEARRYSGMTPTAAVKALAKLEMDLARDDEPEVKQPIAVEKSKAPKPPTPVKDAAGVDPGPARDFDEYRAQRKAQRAAKR